jgi:Universal stress protein family
MRIFRSIVCPVDFSEHSVQALRLAVGLAGRDQARLTVLTVNEPLLVEAAAAARMRSCAFTAVGCGPLNGRSALPRRRFRELLGRAVEHDEAVHRASRS